ALANRPPQREFPDAAVDVFHVLLRVLLLSLLAADVSGEGARLQRKGLAAVHVPVHSGRAGESGWRIFQRRAGPAPGLEKRPPDSRHHRAERFGAVYRGHDADAAQIRRPGFSGAELRRLRFHAADGVGGVSRYRKEVCRRGDWRDEYGGADRLIHLVVVFWIYREIFGEL